MSQNTHQSFVDVLTVTSCIAVVFLHADGVFWLHPAGSLWVSSTVIQSLFYFAVPIFFMISGYTLMDYRDRYDTVTFFKKRILRAFVPFIVWSLIAYFVHLSLGHINKESMWGGGIRDYQL